jgi:hypothetical protein
MKRGIKCVNDYTRWHKFLPLGWGYRNARNSGVRTRQDGNDVRALYDPFRLAGSPPPRGGMHAYTISRIHIAGSKIVTAGNFPRPKYMESSPEATDAQRFRKFTNLPFPMYANGGNWWW